MCLSAAPGKGATVPVRAFFRSVRGIRTRHAFAAFPMESKKCVTKTACPNEAGDIKMTSKYSSKSFFFGMIVLAAAMVGITLFCGSLTGRWGLFKGLEESQNLLRELPMTIGDWTADEEKTLSTTDMDMLQIRDGYVCRTYKNKKTQENVSFVLMVGPTGRVVVHTPEICFGGRNYEREKNRERISVPITDYSGSGPTDDEFWKVNFVSRSVQNDVISFYYGVSTGESWLAMDTPRTSLQRFRYVYKIQIEAFADKESDAIGNFLHDCLPTIRQYLRHCE